MPESITLATTKQAAMRAVEQMTRPDTIGKTQWRGVHALLRAIARSYPKAYPSERTLARRLDVDVRTVKRYVAAAKAANLLVVTPDAGAEPRSSMGSRTNRYHLVHGDNLAPQENTNSYGVGSSSSRRTSSSVPRSAPAAQDPSEPQRSTVVLMRDWQDERSRDVGTSAAPRLERTKWPVRPDADALVSSIDSRRRKAKREPKPPPEWKRLADYFEVCWRQMQMETGRYKDTRGLENYRMARTYITKHFDNRTELEVRKMMEEFVIAVSKRRITVKPGQSAWMCFTGAWGRQRHVVTDDRYAAYRSK